MALASRMNDLGTETAFEVLAKARALEAQGREIIHLEIGEPDFDTPRHIVEAGVEALRKGHTHYGPTPGLPALREAISRNSREGNGLIYLSLCDPCQPPDFWRDLPVGVHKGLKCV